MATVNTTNALSTASKTSATKSSSARMADNFDQFLSLLTTQLKNQSPLDPLDTNQFTQQLVQFAGVEQQIKTNDNLNSLLLANRNATITNAMSFVGARVTADGSTTQLQNGVATWQLNAPRTGAATIVVTDKNNNQVYSTQTTLNAGDQPFTWDGRMSNGQTAASGAYKITVAAKDTSGQAMSVKSEISGIVDSVDVSGDAPVLWIGNVQLPVGSVRSIRRN